MFIAIPGQQYYRVFSFVDTLRIQKYNDGTLTNSILVHIIYIRLLNLSTKLQQGCDDGMFIAIPEQQYYRMFSFVDKLRSQKYNDGTLTNSILVHIIYIRLLNLSTKLDLYDTLPEGR